MIDLAAWRAMWQALGAEHVDDRLHGRLIACWSEPHRSYHTLQHLRECLEHFESARGEATRPAEVEAGLWFHDAFYDPQRDDNEARSADWARRSMLEAGLPKEAADRVHALVIATRHEAPPQDADAQLLVDIDLSILGAPRARFDESNQQIREEYAHVPERDYRERRRRVLKGFLNRPRLYNTERFRARLEARARENLQRELARLSSAVRA